MALREQPDQRLRAGAGAGLSAGGDQGRAGIGCGEMAGPDTHGDEETGGVSPEMALGFNSAGDQGLLRGPPANGGPEEPLNAGDHGDDCEGLVDGGAGISGPANSGDQGEFFGAGAGRGNVSAGPPKGGLNGELLTKTVLGGKL